jgi:hypothetical protein
MLFSFLFYILVNLTIASNQISNNRVNVNLMMVYNRLRFRLKIKKKHETIDGEIFEGG